MVWEEEWSSAVTEPVEVSGGIFSVELGSWNDIGDDENVIVGSELYLQVMLGDADGSGWEKMDGDSDPQKVAYQHLVSVPYAMGSQGDFIVANGNLGVGTADPGYALDVRNTQDNGGVQIRGDGTDNKNIRLILSNGGLNAGDTIIKFDHPGTGDIGGEDAWTIGVDRSDVHKFKISASGGIPGTNDYLTVQGNGNVGIGTTRPEAKLSIAGGGKSTYINPGDLQIYYDSWRRLQITADTPDLYKIRALDYNGDPDANLMLDAGNVGIGRAVPDYKLDVDGGDIHTYGSLRSDQDLYVEGQMFGARLNLTGEGVSSYVLGHGGGMNYGVVASTSHTFVVGEADIARISDQGVQIITGNMGIGTSPNSQYKLDVNGDIRADDIILDVLLSKNISFIDSTGNYFDISIENDILIV
ncbi:MAG: hypothetical protein HY538_09280 [Deltaproteobacteria bacterium]|nr:hypothetical protein [Deltaproteobacteria bacterium]